MLYQKLFSKSHFRKIPSFWHWLPWSLTQWPHLKSVDKTLPGFFQGYLMIFADLFYHGFRYVNDCLTKYAKLGKIWRLVTSGVLNFGLGKIWPELFGRNFVQAIEHFFRFSLQCLKPPPRTILSLLEPARNRIKTLGNIKICAVDIQVLTSYLLEMQNLSKIKKWQSTVTATAKKVNSVKRDVLVGMYVLTLHRYLILASPS